jgi:hypothetical protein
MHLSSVGFCGDNHAALPAVGKPLLETRARENISCERSACVSGYGAVMLLRARGCAFDDCKGADCDD